MPAFDASSMIYAWDNYPIGQFPGLWEWVANQIEAKQLVMPSVAFEEVQGKMPDCCEWLKYNDIKRLPVTNAILQDAARIKDLLGITGDRYHPKGVGENDILIIATAHLHVTELVSEEQRQNNLPDIMSRYKIPAVCLLHPVSVPCINFVEYIKDSGAIFR